MFVLHLKLQNHDFQKINQGRGDLKPVLGYQKSLLMLWMLKVLNLVQKVKGTKKLKLILIKYFVGIYSGRGMFLFSIFVNVLDMINILYMI